jgi:hypothetical protein
MILLSCSGFYFNFKFLKLTMFRLVGIAQNKKLNWVSQNEELNGGGILFVEKHKDLRVRVVHGNTLTAAVIIKQLPVDLKEVFMTGATSKLGRAIALYLCQRGVRVLVGLFFAMNYP